MRRYLIGAGLGHVIGGLFGVAFLPLGWMTVLFGSAALIGAYIAQTVWREWDET